MAQRIVTTVCCSRLAPPPVHLDIPGADQIYYLRSFDDSRAIIAAAEKAKRAVVIGASFIGLEVAASLRKRKLEVHVVGPDQHPLEKVVGPEVGDFVRRSARGRRGCNSIWERRRRQSTSAASRSLMA